MKMKYLFLIILLAGCDSRDEYLKKLDDERRLSMSEDNIYEPQLKTVNEIEYFYKTNPNTSYSICDFNKFEGQKDLYKNLRQGEFEKTADFQERVAKMKDEYDSKWTGIIRHKYLSGSLRNREDDIKYNPDSEITTININPRYGASRDWYKSNDYVIEHGDCGSSSNGYYGFGEWILAFDVDLSRLGLSNYRKKLSYDNHSVLELSVEKKYTVEDVKKLKYEEIYNRYGTSYYNEFITYLGFENISNINKETYCRASSTYEKNKTGRSKQCFRAIETNADIAYFFVFSTKLNEFIHTYMSKNYADKGLLNDINFARFLLNKNPLSQEEYSEQDLIRMYIEVWDDGYRTSYHDDRDPYYKNP